MIDYLNNDKDIVIDKVTFFPITQDMNMSYMEFMNKVGFEDLSKVADDVKDEIRIGILSKVRAYLLQQSNIALENRERVNYFATYRFIYYHLNRGID